MDEVDWDLMRKQFLEKIPIFERLKDEVLFIVKQSLNQTDIKIYSIPTRVKDVDSFLDKARRKEYKKPFEEIQDIVGLRIVCLFLSDIGRISDLVRASFDIISEDNKINDVEATLFGYLSVHFIAKLRSDCIGPRYNFLKGIPFEVQIRTLTMDAWANISHYLDYKSDTDIPTELKRDFYALSGLFYVADTHFEMFFKSKSKVAKRLEATDFLPTQEINMDSLRVFLAKRLPDRTRSNLEDISMLVRQLLSNGYSSIGELEVALDISKDALIALEKESRVNFTDLGVVRVSLDLCDENWRQSREGGWNKRLTNKYRKLFMIKKSNRGNS
jgi:putative GTP pyrophosphokinase